MNFVILAAGKGQRMGITTPKCMLRLNQKHTILGRLLDQARKCDLTPIIVAGYRCRSLVRDYGQRAPCLVNPGWRDGGSLRSFQHAIRALGTREPLVVGFGSDIFTFTSLAMIRSQPDQALVMPWDGKGAKLRLDGRLICDISTAQGVWSPYSWGGLACFSPKSLQAALDMHEDADVSPVWCLHGFRGLEGLALNINTPEDLTRARLETSCTTPYLSSYPH